MACGSGISDSSEQADAKVETAPPSSDASPGCTADLAETYFADSDGDGYGTSSLTAVDCIQPAGFVDNSLDCNDSDASINPDGIELCDGIDNDCKADTVESCPNECSVHGEGLSIYLFCNVGANHANATTICGGEGMQLVRVDDANEQAYLSEERIIAFGGRTKTWLGGSDLTVENAWLWQDGDQFWQGRSGGTAVGGLFQFWRGGEPNDDGTEDCAAMRNNNSSTGRWVDSECSQVLQFICERNPSTP